MTNFVSAWVANRRAIRDLSRLSDRELADCGIQRDHIKTIVADASGRGPGSADLAAMAPSWGHHNRRALSA